TQRLPVNRALALVTHAASGIRTVADLRGRRVAFTRGTATQTFLLQALAQQGLTSNDITGVDAPLVSLGGVLDSGSADAAVLIGPQIAAYLAQRPDAVQLEVQLPVASLILASRKVLADPAGRAAVLSFVEQHSAALAE